MAERTKVALLGFNESVLNQVCEKINSSRPVQVSCFTDLKDFLAFCTDNKPDIAGISVAYPHKSILKFPKLFKTSYGIPVISFCESLDGTSRKMLAASQSDYKISAVVNAHNLWMKIINYQRVTDVEQSSSDESESTLHNTGSTFVLKGGKNSGKQGDRGSILTSLLAAMDEDKEHESDINHVSSGETTNFQRDHAQVIKKGAETTLGDDLDEEGLDAPSTVSGREEDPDELHHLHDGEIEQGDGDDESAVKASLMALQEEIARAKKNSVSDVEGENNEVGDNPFGKIKYEDEKEVKAHESEKLKEKSKKEEAKIKNILVSCCEIALKTCFSANNTEFPKSFPSEKISVYIVEVDGYQGFLSLANNLNQEIDSHTLDNFRMVVLENLVKNGLLAQISHCYSIQAQSESYIEAVNQFSDFLIFHEEESGRQQAVSFIKREAVRPQYEESESDDRYIINFKVIPPQTPVNFDAYLYLPRNNRFVKYLKEGRSLSLDQANRHIENEANHKLYLAKGDIDKFIQYYIQNTIGWEFAIYQKPKKDVA